MKPTLRVLFLTRYPVAGASSRYRVFQYLPHLRELGVECDVQSFMDDSMYALSTRPGNAMRKIFDTVRAYARRLAMVARWHRYDIVYMQRELLPFGPPVVEAWLKRRGAVLFFDYDDALFIHKASRYNPLATLLRSPRKTLELFSLVDCVVAGNDWLRDVARKQGGRAETIEVAEDTHRIRMHAPHTNDRPVTIGWLGSPSTAKYLHFIAPVLRETARRHPSTRFEIVGGGEFAMDGVDWHSIDWSFQNELDALARFDIGLMPLPQEDWARGKSGGKARTYMAAGVVPVCQAIGYNLELIRHGETGFLCSTDAEWFECIDGLIRDCTLRQRVAVAARADVQRRFSLAKQAAQLHALFLDVLERRKAAA